MYPLKLTAPCKDYIWGGTRLREEFGKEAPTEKIAESWELSCHKDGESVIANGEYAGRTLSAYLSEVKTAIGTSCLKYDSFPILIKLIDAKENLSIQVHPDDEYALRVEGEYGKTEMWYVVDCEEGAELVYGFREEISKLDFADRIKNNTLSEVLNHVKVNKGDVFFIPAGTLHGIGKGNLIAEIQQSSNTTYRVYDYGRRGADGRPRELHVEKAIQVTQLAPSQPAQRTAEREQGDGHTTLLLSECEYFRTRHLDITEKAALKADIRSFHALLVLDGEGEIDGVRLKKGDTCFIPAGYGAYCFMGRAEVILTDIA